MRVRTYTNAEIRGTQSESKTVREKKRQPSKSPAEKPPAKRLKRVYRRMPTSPPPQSSQSTTPDKKSRSRREDASFPKTAEESSETDSDAPLGRMRR